MIRPPLRLALVNFEMDNASPVLAWQATVASALARSCECVLVLTERVGQYTPPDNVVVHRLKSRLDGAPHRLVRSHRINACLVHMNHRWTYRLAPMLRLRRIPCVLWYAHGSVTPSLRWALRCADRIVTSTPEGFRIPSPKVRVIGQGIDTEQFRIPAFAPERTDILSVGRVSRRKRVHLLLEIMHRLNAIAPEHGLRLRLVGPTLTPDDVAYEQELRRQCAALNLDRQVEFVGWVPSGEVSRLYQTAALHLSVSETGSLDKAVLEALACGCPVLTNNIACQRLLAEQPDFYLPSEDPEDLARGVLRVKAGLERYSPAALRGMVEGAHDLRSYAAKLVAQLDEIR